MSFPMVQQATAALVAVLGFSEPPEPLPAPVVPVVHADPDQGLDDVGLLVADPCADSVCVDRREVYVDYEALGLDTMRGGEWIAYDFDEVTRPLQQRELIDESEISLAVRLIISEVGADRLLTNRYGLLEAIGILYTVDNRLDPLVYNVQNVPNAPSFPGCGPAGTFGSCANAQQYLGMATWRATNPSKHYKDQVLEPAVDLAVLAWWLQEHGYVADFTDGATNYVHRCGAAAYGMTTWHCDAHTGNTSRDDIRGGNPFTGPIVFKGPTAWGPRQGFYGLREARRIEYDPWWDLGAVTPLSQNNDGLADADTAAPPPPEMLLDADAEWARELGFVPPAVKRRSFAKYDPIAADATLNALVDQVGPERDPRVVATLVQWQIGG